MTSPPSWDEMSKRWRELYDQQAELARSWVDGQAKLAGTLAAAVPGEPAKAEAEAMAELWRSWLNLGGSLGSMPGMGEPGRIAGETLGRFLDPMSLALVGGSQVGETIRRLTEGPRLADLGAIERRMARVMELWLAVQQRARAYEAVVAGAWVEANRRFATEYQERVRAGTAPTEPKEALKLWLDIANRTLLETHRSEQFLKAQGELLRHGMDFLLAEREMVESLVEPAGLPTRSEIDEVHRSVLDLKRRVRALEKAAKAEPAGRRRQQRRPESPSAADREPSHDPDAHGRHGRADARGRRLQRQARGRGREAGPDQGRGRPDRDHAQGRGLPHRQGHALPLPPAGRAEDQDPGPDRLQPDRPLHDDRPAGGPLADPQPAEAGASMCGWSTGATPAAPTAT